MPEGPTIKVAADMLRDVLLGRVIQRFESRYRKAAAEDWSAKIQGWTVERVHSHGKNLFITFDSDYIMYTHMLMWGAWHVYRLGEEWLKEASKARVILETDAYVAVLFSAPVCELIPRADLATHKTATTGPDLLGDTFDTAEALRRFHLPEHAEREVGELIMDQTVMAGIGNILKSEILFQAGIHPQRLPGTVTDDEFERFAALSQELMRASYELGTFNGAFLPADAAVEKGKLGYVYRRRTYPCLRCGTPIRMVRQGAGERMTYYCPHCQPYRGEHNPDLVPERTRRKKTDAARAAGGPRNTPA